MLNNYSSASASIMTLGILIFVLVLLYILYRILRNPFQYPYFIHTFDVTSKRNVKIENYIDNFLCDSYNWHLIQMHEKRIQSWKAATESYIKTCKLRGYRTKQYRAVLDDDHAYCFETVRKQTRYQQHNYVKTPYKVSVIDLEHSVNLSWLMDRYNQLEKIGFAATLDDYYNMNQRKLMTRSLRKQIMERDRYTCQNCGKYMPDEVGLHIDHIIPIAKGGKSIPSNLRVLCSKCNGSKGAKCIL